MPTHEEIRDHVILMIPHSPERPLMDDLVDVIAMYLGDMEEFESMPTGKEIEMMYDILLYKDVLEQDGWVHQ